MWPYDFDELPPDEQERILDEQAEAEEFDAFMDAMEDLAARHLDERLCAVLVRGEEDTTGVVEAQRMLVRGFREMSPETVDAELCRRFNIIP